MLRNRFKHTTTFEERLKNEAARLRGEAERLPPGQQRDGLLKKARQTEMVNELDKWLSASELQAPR